MQVVEKSTNILEVMIVEEKTLVEVQECRKICMTYGKKFVIEVDLFVN